MEVGKDIVESIKSLLGVKKPKKKKKRKSKNICCICGKKAVISIKGKQYCGLHSYKRKRRGRVISY
jgi:hypothetical protein